MKNEGMTVDEAYKELKGDIEGMAAKHDELRNEFKADIQGMATKQDLKVGLDELRNEFKAEMSKMRTWVISLFIGAVVIMGDACRSVRQHDDRATHITTFPRT